MDSQVDSSVHCRRCRELADMCVTSPPGLLLGSPPVTRRRLLPPYTERSTRQPPQAWPRSWPKQVEADWRTFLSWQSGRVRQLKRPPYWLPPPLRAKQISYHLCQYRKLAKLLSTESAPK